MTTAVRSTAATSSPSSLPQPPFNIISTEGSALQAIDQVAAQQLGRDNNPSPRSLQGRVTPPSTPRDSTSQWFDPQTPGSSEEDADETSPFDQETFSVFSLTSNRTPPASPVKARPKTTPEALKDLETIIANNDPGYDLTPKSKTTLKKAVSKLDELNSPYRGLQKAKVRTRFGAALEKTGSTTPVASPGVVRRLLFSSTNYDDVSGQWTKDLAKSLDVSILDAKHLQDLEDQGGFHICSANHPRDRFVIQRRTHLLTGVWCGRVCAEEDRTKILKKFTSFIPRTMTLERYQFLIAQMINNDSCKIAQQDNRRLYRVVDGKNSFVIECYFQQDGTRIRSAIPVFHYEIYNGKDKSFKVPYSYKWSLADNDPIIPATFEVVYEQLFELLKGCPDAIVYETNDKIVVDLGKLYSGCPIDQGLLVEISKKLF